LSKFWKRQRRVGLDSDPPPYRPRPRAEFRQALATRVDQSRPSSLGRLRIAYAAGLSAVLLVALGAFGGLGYAATGGKQAAKAAAKVFSKSGNDSSPRADGQAQFTPLNTPAENQYRGQRCTIQHRTGHGFIIIEVAGEAVPAHMRHGDPSPIECHPR